MLKVALTGGIATGKTYVRARLEALGAACIEADRLAHGVMEPGTEATQAIAAMFGPGVLNARGAVDRTVLGPMVFGDPEARRALEAIVHAVVSLGRGLGMKVTAEGVETAEQHLFLRAAGVHCMQGFRFGRPAEAAAIATRLATPGVYRSIESDAVAALAS